MDSSPTAPISSSVDPSPGATAPQPGSSPPASPDPVEETPSLSDPLDPQVLLQRLAASEAAYQQLRSQLESVEESLLNGSGLDPSVLDYKFEPEVESVLETHPARRTTLTKKERTRQMKSVPLLEKQTRVPQCNDTHLTSKLSGFDSVLFIKTLPEAQALWSTEVRVTGYAYDLLLKASKEYGDDVDQDPLLANAVNAAHLAFMLAIGAQHKIEAHRRTILGRANAGSYYHPPPTHDTWEFLDKKERSDLEASAKQFKDAGGNSSSKRRRFSANPVFGKGSGRGRPAPPSFNRGHNNDFPSAHRGGSRGRGSGGRGRGRGYPSKVDRKN